MSDRQILIPCEVQPEELRGVADCSLMMPMEGATMGTYWRVQCACDNSISQSTIYQTIEDSCQLIVQQMSHFDPLSCLSRFNALPADSWMEVPYEFAAVMRVALTIASHTHGAYDPTIGDLIDAYGFGAKKPQLPIEDAEISVTAIRRFAHVGRWNRLAISCEDAGESHSELQSRTLPQFLPKLGETVATDRVATDTKLQRCSLYQPGGVELNLSSIAKGFAVDLIAERLNNLGVKHFLIEIGGELKGQGCKPDGSPWWCTLEQPAALLDDTGASTPTGYGECSSDSENRIVGDKSDIPSVNQLPETIVALCGVSIATSGDFVQQSLLASGERISHLVDPRSGLPATSELAMVTVLHPSCCQADAWATGLYILGLKEGLELANSLGLNALFTKRSKSGFEQVMSEGLKAWCD